jgi:hypothetical protein
MEDINFNSKLKEIENLLNMYQRRKISLIGKIAIIKSLAIPKLIHLFTVLPTPSPKLIDKIENSFKGFLWNNKKRRLSYEQMCKEKELGGLGMTHIRTLIHSIKVTWVKRLISTEGSWQELFKSIITDDIELIWELDISSLETFYNKISNKFWKGEFIGWGKYRKNKANMESEHYPIWNSNFLNVKGIIRDKISLQREGLNYVKDLLNEDGHVLGYLEFQNRFNCKVNFVDFYSLMHCLRPEWRHRDMNLVKTESKMKLCVAKISKTKKVCKMVYSNMMEEFECPSTNELKWQNIGMNINQEEWKDLYKIPFIVTIETKLQSFQYQIIKRCLVTNKYLFMCKIKDSDLCYFCNQKVETIEHLFFDCPIVKKIWFEICNIMPKELNFRKYVTRKAILLGITIGNYKTLLNQLLIICKRYIYVTKCLGKSLHIQGYLRDVKMHYAMECEIAKKNQVEHKLIKWNILGPILD